MSKWEDTVSIYVKKIKATQRKNSVLWDAFYDIFCPLQEAYVSVLTNPAMCPERWFDDG